MAGSFAFALSGTLAFAGIASASSTAAPVTHCALAQQRVDLITAVQQVVVERSALLEARLQLANTNGRAARVQRINNRLSLVAARQAKLNTRLHAVEQACSVVPTS